jgi:hypothetical protein
LRRQAVPVPMPISTLRDPRVAPATCYARHTYTVVEALRREEAREAPPSTACPVPQRRQIRR